MPNFSFEKRLWKKGLKYVAGVDEVGRGCFAGPVVAASVVFSANTNIPQDVYINDSKKVTKLRREKADKWIKENAISWGIGELSAKVINREGMAKATKMSFRQAVGDANKRLHQKIDFLLIDAFYIPYVRGFPKGRNKAKARRSRLSVGTRAKQLAIINGDEKSFSIAAASIVAKVYRDSLMEKIGSRPIYKRYDWVSNKGYASKHHRDAILKYGITGYHREQFVKTFLNNSSSSPTQLSA